MVILAISSHSVYALDPSRQISQYSYKKWGVDEQLPQVTVTALAQDKQGYLWIGTQSGVARFNGKEFVAFNRANTTAFTSDLVKDLLYDSMQQLWVLTDGGLAVSDSSGFSAIPILSDQVIKPNNLVDYLGNVIISSSNGLHRIVNRQVEPFVINNESYALKAIEKVLYVGGRGQIGIIENNIATSFDFPKEYGSAIVNDLRMLNGTLWLATTKGPLTFKDGVFRAVFAEFLALNSNISALHIDEEDVLWLAAESGVYRVSDNQLFRKNDIQQYHRVSRFLQDRDNTLWLGTFDRGLYQLRDSWSARYDNAQGLDEDLAWSVAKNSKGKLYVGSQEGIYRLDDQRFKAFVRPEQLPNASAYTLFFENDDLLWIGTKSGLYAANASGEVLTGDEHVLLIGKQIHAIYIDSKNRMWIATNQGLYLKKSNKLLQIGDSSLYLNESYRAIVEFQNQIYFGTHQGLFEWLEGGTKIERIPELSSSFVTSSLVVGELLFVGTYGNGLYVFDGNKWFNLTTEQGLVFNTSFSISLVEDSLWISGFDGVYRLYLESVLGFIRGQDSVIKSEPILKDSGYIPGSQKAYCCNGAGHAKSEVINGDIWFPTRKGVLKLQPSKISRDIPVVHTIIENVGSADGIIDLYFGDENLDQKNETSFESRDIYFKFIGLTSLDEGLVKYRYRLVGYNANWIDNGSSRNVSYTNLPAGDFVFEIKASNREGVWADIPTRFKFVVNARFHETSTFKLILIIFSIVLLYFFYRFMLYINRRKVKALESLILKKTEALVLSNQELQEANSKLTVHSYTDPLTGVHNRRYFVKQIVSDIAHYIRTSSLNSVPKNIVFVLADIDFFKDINDQHGHNTGDEVLKQVVNCLKENIRDGDYLIRWGGEEFLLALRPDHVFAVEDLCDRLVRNIRQHQFSGIKDEVINLTISLGFCFYPLSQTMVERWGWEDALEMADKAMYQAKHQGRNRWVGFELLQEVIDSVGMSSEEVINSSDFQRYSGTGDSFSNLK